MKTLNEYVNHVNAVNESLKPMTMPSDISGTFLKFIDFLEKENYYDGYIKSVLETNPVFGIADITEKSESASVKIVGTLYYLGLQPKDWLEAAKWETHTQLTDARKKWHEKLK